MNLKNKNVLISGITGFVGPYLARALIARGANVFGLVRRRSDGSRPRNLVDREVYDDVGLIQGDITDIASIGLCLRESDPDVIFHLAAQSFVPGSFTNPLEALATNATGTANLLEVIRFQGLDPVVVLAGSSEEYGLAFVSEKHHQQAMKRYGEIFPEPERLPEVPINEHNPLRPISPYAVSKVHADYLMRSYHSVYGLKTIVSRAFNHEGAGRGIIFVTAAITSQVMKLKLGESDTIVVGNVNTFRDWSHVSDIVEGYCILAEEGRYGDTYVLGSGRTNSVLSYILLSLQNAGWEVRRIEGMKNGKRVENPTEKDYSPLLGLNFEKTKVDRAMLEDELEFTLEDTGIWVDTDRGRVPIVFDHNRCRRADVPILLSDPTKAKGIGFQVSHTLEDIIGDQLNYFMNKENRSLG